MSTVNISEKRKKFYAELEGLAEKYFEDEEAEKYDRRYRELFLSLFEKYTDGPDSIDYGDSRWGTDEHGNPCFVLGSAFAGSEYRNGQLADRFIHQIFPTVFWPEESNCCGNCGCFHGTCCDDYFLLTDGDCLCQRCGLEVVADKAEEAFRSEIDFSSADPRLDSLNPQGPNPAKLSELLCDWEVKLHWSDLLEAFSKKGWEVYKGDEYGNGPDDLREVLDRAILYRHRFVIWTGRYSWDICLAVKDPET